MDIVNLYMVLMHGVSGDKCNYGSEERMADVDKCSYGTEHGNGYLVRVNN